MEVVHDTTEGLRPLDDPPTPLLSLVDTGGGDRGGAPPSLQWWRRRLSAVERVLALWFSGTSKYLFPGPGRKLVSVKWSIIN